MPRITSEQLQHLIDLGNSFAEIGRMLGISREMVRRYALRYGLNKQCAKCGDTVSARRKFCVACSDADRLQRAKASRRSTLKTFGNRPVVIEAYQYFQSLGRDVVLDVESPRNRPEVWVDGQSVKCNRIVPVSRGHQVRLTPNMQADFWYLSDGQMRFVIPTGAVQNKVTYLAESSPLQQWRVADE